MSVIIFFIAESYSLLAAYHKWYIILLIGIQVVSRFLPLKTKLLRKLRGLYVYVFSLIKYLEAELLAQRACVFEILIDVADCLSEML